MIYAIKRKECEDHCFRVKGKKIRSNKFRERDSGVVCVHQMVALEVRGEGKR